MDILKSIALALAVVATPSAAYAQGDPCNGSVSEIHIGGSTSSCPVLRETWDKQATGNVACNDQGTGIAKPQTSTTVTLTATGTCSGTSVQCGYSAPQGSVTAVTGSGSTWTWAWYNGTFSGGCLNSDQTSYKVLSDLSPCTAGFCCSGTAETHCTSQGVTRVWNSNDCACQVTPLFIALEGTWENALTSAEGGAPFKLEPTGQLLRVAWTQPNQGRVAWLARDRNGNGHIDDLSELYSSTMPHFSANPGGPLHGFTALASEDSNGDGAITSDDATYDEMTLWFDRNQNGLTDRGELQSLSSRGLVRLSLRYKSMYEKDSGGNTIIFESRGVQQVGRSLRSIAIYDALVKTALLPTESRRPGAPQ